MLYIVDLTFKSIDENLTCRHIQMYGTGQYFPVTFIILYEVASTLSTWMKSSNVTIQIKDIEQ